jgi:DNA-binding response OmpR family regulator
MAGNAVGNDPRPDRLPEAERAVLAVLIDHVGRVVTRRELARLAGLADRSQRRCDAALVVVRRHLGADSVQTVRGRGWMLDPACLDAARLLLS